MNDIEKSGVTVAFIKAERSKEILIALVKKNE